MSKRNKGPHVAKRTDRGWWGVREFINGQRHWIIGGCPSEQEAQDELIEILIQRRQGRTKLKDIRVGEVLAYYLDNHIPHTARPQRGLTYHDTLTPFWAKLMVQEINKAKCQNYIQIRRQQFKSKRNRDISNDSLRAEIEHLNAALNYAHDNNYIEVLPKLWKPPKAPARERWLNRNELALLLNAARKSKAKHLSLFILLALYTGARSGAILDLKWTQVDLKNGIIDFRPSQKSQTKGYSIVPIPPKLKFFLERSNRQSEYVIHIHGQPIKSVKTSFEYIRKEARLEGKVTPNTLRHTHASLLKQDGIASAFIAENMGHSTPDMVDRTYGHMSKVYLDIIKQARWGKAA
ncbi:MULTISPECIES: tyrosine-type recombinase/integrase [Roseivirga]|uniref:Tyr recombinase domain-containing protein n=1 Tax=Roseivirga spongicola TaxID=333140 RepID=A0A150XEU9_9BACT|nr:MULTISPECIES: site-specific integrase [Roseivirga]KYG77231.1 hypothetical protein AWW68_00230 [Roseivirga spongicola]MBO6662684.1 site-specific integrase [Roseivirga sp.]MBO6761643.1 site-specific integrase [Roseivirga sp.]MBO6909691.1 site-specific integrase [Roseivirga sp.]WPZ10932.1 site-specific integrase [Roseivirga spongicola]